MKFTEKAFPEASMLKKALQAIVSMDDVIDTSTSQGRSFFTLIAVTTELEHTNASAAFRRRPHPGRREIWMVF